MMEEEILIGDTDKMKTPDEEWKDLEKKVTSYERRNTLGCLGVLGGVFIGIPLVVISLLNEEAKPTDKAYDTVTVNSSDMTYDIAFACTRQERDKDLCIKAENLESVFINKRDYWTLSYSTKRSKYELPLLPQMQEQAWRMTQAEHYLRMYAEEDQQ